MTYFVSWGVKPQLSQFWTHCDYAQYLLHFRCNTVDRQLVLLLCKWLIVAKSLYHMLNAMLFCWLSEQRMLVYDPPQRISAVAALHHPYFADLDTDSLPSKWGLFFILWYNCAVAVEAENLWLQLNWGRNCDFASYISGSQCETYEFICYRWYVILALHWVSSYFPFTKISAVFIHCGSSLTNCFHDWLSCSLLLVSICYLSLHLCFYACICCMDVVCMDVVVW